MKMVRHLLESYFHFSNVLINCTALFHSFSMLVRYDVTLLTWLTVYSHLLKTPPKFLNIVCSGNTKPM